MGTTPDTPTNPTVEMDALPDVGARAFVTTCPNPVSLVVWDRDNGLHKRGEVWGLFQDGRQIRPTADRDELTQQVTALTNAALDFYGARLSVRSQQRGLSDFEYQLLDDAARQAD